MADDNDNLAQLRAKADRADALEAQLALRDKQDAFKSAGLDPDSGPGKLLFETFKPGDDQPVNSETVLAFASQYGVAPITPEPVPEEPSAQAPVTPPPNLSPAEQVHFALVNTGAAGSEPDPNSAPLAEQVHAAYSEERRKGVPQEQAATAGIAALIGAAANGNRQALYDGDAWRAQGGA